MNIYQEVYNEVKSSKSNYASCIDSAIVAKMIRFELDKNFPGFKFSVRTSKYSGGSSIHVSWDNGPTEKEVEKIVDLFSGSGFDGMIDMKYDHYHYLTPEGVFYGGTSGTSGSMGYYHPVENEKPQNAIRVSLMSDYIMTSRHLTDDKLKPIVQYFIEHYKDAEGLTFEEYKRGNCDYTINHWINEKIGETSFYIRPLETKKVQTRKEEKPEGKTEQENTNKTYKVVYDRDWSWVYFTEKPCESIRENMKAQGWRFSGKRVAWYNTSHIEEGKIRDMLEG